MEPLFLKKKTALTAILGFVLALGAGAMAIFSGLGTQLDWWHFSNGFSLLKWGVYIAAVAGVFCLLGILAVRPGKEKKGFMLAACGLVIATPVIAVPYFWAQTAGKVPQIHDITTDIDNPPQFEAIVPLRGENANSLEYGGAEIAQLQIKAYPYIEPLNVTREPSEVFEAALATAKQMGWDIASADKNTNRIEATDTTFWFGFKDDIVIRITPNSFGKDGGSKIDVRSVSRVGRSDIGTNASRIQAYLKNLKSSL